MRFNVILLTGLGYLFLALGAIGLFLPIWPTTPFVLAAAGCFSASPRLRARVMRLPFFKEHIENYENRSGLPRAIVVQSLGFLWFMLLLSMLLLKNPWLCLLLFVVGISVTVHILCVAKPKPRNMEEKQ